MPQVVVAVVASWAGSAFVSAVGLVGAWAGVVSGLVSAVVGSALSNAFGLNKPPKGASFSYQARERQQMIRSPVATRHVVYGEAVMSGPIVFAASTGTNNEYLHLIIPLAHGESEAVGAVWFGDERVGDLDGSGDVTTGRFAGKMRIKKHLGASAQTADSDLVSEVTEWTTDHRLRGITYIYVRLQFDQTVYPYGLENIKAEVRGRALYDPRTAGTAWSDNWALAVYDYLTAAYGLNADTAEVNSTAAQAAANLCDERVLVPTLTDTFTASAEADTVTTTDPQPRVRTGDGVRFTTTGTLPSPLVAGTTYYYIRSGPSTGQLATSHANALAGTAIDLTTAGTGTHTLTRYDQPRYTCNGSIDLGNRPIDALRGLLTGALGQVVYSQGTYFIHGAAYATPTVTLDEYDLRGPVKLRAKPSRQDLFNGVRGTFVSPENYWQPADFSPVTNSTYETQDGGEQILRDIELPYTLDNFAAQRLAKIALERGRQGITCTFPAKLTAFKLRCWDTVQVSIAHLGWDEKVFRITRWSLNAAGGVDLELQEEASASYSWASGEATVVDPAPDTTLPSLVNVAEPTSFVLASGDTHRLVNSDGIVTPRIYCTWTAPAEPFLRAYQLEYKISTESAYTSTTLSNAGTSAYISPVQEGATYDVRIRSVNTVGNTSSWVSGSLAASATGSVIAYGSVTGGPPADATRNVIWRQGTAPMTAEDGDIWFDTSDGNRQCIYDGGWVEVRDADIDAALAAAATAQSTADGKIESYYQGGAPLTANDGDIWVDTDDGNLLYVWSGGAWQNAQDSDIAQALTDASDAQATADGKVTTFFTTSTPTAEAVGDLWYSTSTKLLKRWNGSTWDTTSVADVGDLTNTPGYDNTVDVIEGGATVTSGGITFDAGGNIKGGQTDYNTGTGWFLGYSGGNYKFSLGSPSGHFMRWNGTELEVSGIVAKPYTLGTDNLIGNGSGSVTRGAGESSIFWKVADFVIREAAGNVNLFFYYRSTSSSSYAYYQIQKNGVYLTGGQTTSITDVAVSYDINVTYGDTISVLLRAENVYHTAYYSGMKLRYSAPPVNTALFYSH